MSYRSVNIPPDTPQMVARVVREGVDPFLADVHAMLQLPTDETLPAVGCNLSIAHVLLASICGVSGVLYSTTLGTGEAFRGFMTDYYPWDAEPQRENAVSGLEAARILYSEYRNPLAHASGIPVFSDGFGKPREYSPDQRRVVVNRLNLRMDNRPDRGLKEERILELESEPVRPHWLKPPTLKMQGEMPVLCVEALYWGLREAICRLCSNHERMQAAVRFFDS